MYALYMPYFSIIIGTDFAFHLGVYQGGGTLRMNQAAALWHRGVPALFASRYDRHSQEKESQCA
jgi:hypothetical protein